MDAVKRRMLQDKKNLSRRNQRQACREALLIKDYIRIKYADAYKEACAFYNYVNSLYPTKTDLRKTDEFKALVKGHTFVAKNQDTVLTRLLQVYKPISELGLQNFTVHCYMPQTVEPPQTVELPQTIEPPQTVELPQTIEPPQTVELPQTGKTMQLKIPLLSPDLIAQAQGAVTQEITVAANETVPPDDNDVFNELIPQETYEAILSELRQDPDLAKMMDDIELNMEDDIDHMIDLPIGDDRLEEELCDIW